MTLRRSMLWNGMRLVLRSPGALLWTYALNLGLALLFSLRLHAQLASILDHSLAAERLNSAFDLGTLLAVVHRLNYMAPPTGATSYLGLPLYVLGYFILVPGTLSCYRSGASSHLAALAGSGLSYFWQFVRITGITAIVAGIILVPLIMEESSRSAQIDENFVGIAALQRQLPGMVFIFFIAALIRLYFDLVEVYTVQLAEHLREDGKPDRRVRRVLIPALRTLWHNLAEAYFSFLALTLLGFAVLIGTSYLGMQMLAQPHVWPTFLVAQIGLFAMMATRFWQRGAETALALDHVLEFPVSTATDEELEQRMDQLVPSPFASDAQSDPEPASPSLAHPDPGVFHHEVPLTPHPSATESAPEPVAPGQVEPEAPDRHVPWWME